MWDINERLHRSNQTRPWHQEKDKFSKDVDDMIYSLTDFLIDPLQQHIEYFLIVS